MIPVLLLLRRSCMRKYLDIGEPQTWAGFIWLALINCSVAAKAPTLPSERASISFTLASLALTHQVSVGSKSLNLCIPDTPYVKL